MPRTSRRFLRDFSLPFIVSAVFVTLSPAARASEIFPPKLKSIWAAKAKLPGAKADGCPLCHTTDPGRSGSATRKFALTLRGYGLVPGDSGSLKTALGKNKAAKRDGDGDGFTDFDEIATDGTNPNDAKSHRTIVVMPPEPDVGQAGAPPEVENGGAGGASPVGEGGAPAAGPPPECVPTTTIYPNLRRGCGIGNAGEGAPIAAASMFCALILLRLRARRAREEISRGHHGRF
jgi:hypothetical protein